MYPFLLIIIFVLIATACSTRRGALDQVERPEETKSALTLGMTKKEIIKGKTTQAEVMQVFGPPDLVTTTSTGGEMWGYDRVSRDVAYSAYGIGGIGGSSVGGAGIIGGGIGARAGSQTQTVRTMFLLIYFDKKDTVVDYKVSATRF